MNKFIFLHLFKRKGNFARLCMASLLMIILIAGNVLCAEKGRIENLLLKNLELHKVARLLSEGSGRTIIVSSKAADKKVTVFLEDVSVIDAIKSICRAYQLWFVENEDSGIIEVTTLDEYRKTADIYAEEVLEVVPILYPQVEKIGDVIKDIFQDRVVWVTPLDADYAIENMEEAMDRMYLIKDAVQSDFDSTYGNDRNNGNNNSNNYNSNYGRSGVGSRGGGGRYNNSNSNAYGGYGARTSGRYAAARGQGGVNVTADEKMRSDKLIARTLMMKRPEDLDELTGDAMYELSQGKGRRPFAEIVGRPGAVYVSAMVDTNSLILRSMDKKAVERVKKVIKRLDKPTSQVLMELKVLDVRVGRDKAVGVDWLFTGFNNSVIRRVNALPSSPSIQNEGAITANLNSNGNSSLKLDASIAGIDPRTAVFSVLSNALSFRIKALEEDGKLAVLGTPTLIVADGEASQLFVGTESTILKSVEIEKSTRGDDEQFTDTILSPKTERVKVGTSLFITPQIHADKTVTIRIMQSNSVLGDQKEIRYGGNESNYFITQDVESRSVTTTAIAADGNIVAVSGLITERKDNRVRKVPGLSRIPVIGKIFTSKERENTRSELMVLVRPYVLIGPDQSEQVSMDFLKRVSIHPSAKDDLPELGVGRVDNGEKTVFDKRTKFLDEEITDWVMMLSSKLPIYKSRGACMYIAPDLVGESELLKSAAGLETAGKYIQAVAAYKEVMANSKSEKEKDTAQLGAVRCLIAMRRYDAALTTLGDFTDQIGTPQNRLRLAMAGEVLLRMKNPEGAESAFEMALSKMHLAKADPGWVGAVCANLGRAYVLNRKSEKAAKIYVIASKAFGKAGDITASTDCKNYSVKCMQ